MVLTPMRNYYCNIHAEMFVADWSDHGWTMIAGQKRLFEI
jgi:hypothetical protein